MLPTVVRERRRLDSQRSGSDSPAASSRRSTTPGAGTGGRRTREAARRRLSPRRDARGTRRDPRAPFRTGGRSRRGDDRATPHGRTPLTAVQR
jgi:hypothetical protein